MTEDEAKTKWCPHRRTIEDRGNVSHVTNAIASCIGSECMAWREINRVIAHDVSAWPNEREHAIYVKHNPIHGYCGLAGKP